MKRWVVDTNVPVAANGRDDGDRPVTIKCRAAVIRFLQCILDKRECVVLDKAGEIEKEYRRYLKPCGQPGVGDLFYRAVLSDWSLCQRVELPRHANGEYADLPQAVIAVGFDPDDRKFAALAKREDIPVANAVDSDWLDAHDVLSASGIRVKFLCGRNPARWRAP